MVRLCQQLHTKSAWALWLLIAEGSWCSCFLLFRWWGCMCHFMTAILWRRCANGTRVSWTSRECIVHCSAGLIGIFLLLTQQELCMSPLNGHVSGDPRDGLSQTWGQGQSSGSPPAPHDLKSLWFLNIAVMSFLKSISFTTPWRKRDLATLLSTAYHKIISPFRGSNSQMNFPLWQNQIPLFSV